MAKKFYVYETPYGECFITDKEVTKDWSAIFKSVRDAENWVDENGGALYLDRDVISESQYSWVGDDYDYNTMTADDWFSDILELAKDLCKGFEDEKDLNDVMNRVVFAIKQGYTIQELWNINNEDSTKCYDIIYNFELSNYGN